MSMIKPLISAMNLKGYKVFENDSKPLNLNYVGIRDLSGLGKINDLFILFWKYRGKWNYLQHWGTTDPGVYYEQHLLNSKGVAILKEGQYPRGWTVGMHRKSYAALVQNTKVTVIRDGDRDGKLEIDGGVEETGWFGINHHRMHADAEVSKVGKYSAGCQVRHNPHDYDIFMSICKEAEEVWGKGITYTLLNVNDVKI